MPPAAAAHEAGLWRLAEAMLARGSLPAARACIGALRRRAPGCPDDLPELIELEARLLVSEGETEAAASHLDRAIERLPTAVSLRLCRAASRLNRGDAAGAASDAAEALTLEPAQNAAKALLGLALFEVGWLEEAAACLAEALRAAPSRVQLRLALASALERRELRADAIAVLEEGFAHAPDDPALRIGAITAEMRRQGFERAATLAAEARRDGIANACVFGLLGHALSVLGRHEAAGAAYEDALKLAPEDRYVRHLVGAAGLLPGGSRAPEEYVQAVFDGYAETFDEHLIALGYRVPGLLRALVLAALPDLRGPVPFGPVLDLGCGTGLMGVVLSDLALEGLTGVDLSARMLDRAAARKCYAELHRCDIEAFLAADAREWRLVLAADVLCYLGALDGLFAAVRARLAPDGLFAFTVESPDCETDHVPGWQLQRLGRYVHTVSCVERCAARNGLRIRVLSRETMRRDAGADVTGLVVVAGRAPLDG